MPRFFIDKSCILGNNAYVSGDDFNHIKNVLRLKSGENITLCDGEGMDYLVRISSFEQDKVKTDLLESSKNLSESKLKITLFQGLPKSDKMDFIIQKCVELGVVRIVPVITERTVVKIENRKDAEKKTVRWQRIVLEAAKQSNRGIVPAVELPVSFGDALRMAAEADLSIIPYEKEETTGLKGLLKNECTSISVIIGPEGGFSEKEIQKAQTEGIKPVTLGPRILRTETAGIAVMSILMYELGDVG